MKKFLSLALVFVLMISIVACSKRNENKDNKPEPEPESISYELTSLNEPLIIDTDKLVKITLNNLNISFDNTAIYIKKANDVEIYLEGNNVITYTGNESNAAIVSDVDVTFFGRGSLYIESSGSCIKAPNLIIMNGTYNFIAKEYGFYANKTLTVNSTAMNIEAEKCLEATQITMNGGKLDLKSTGIAISAIKAVDNMKSKFTLNSGTISIKMTGAYACAVNSEGDIIIHDGKIDMKSMCAFKYTGEAIFNGGTVYVNSKTAKTLKETYEDEEENTETSASEPETSEDLTTSEDPEITEDSITSEPTTSEDPVTSEESETSTTDSITSTEPITSESETTTGSETNH